jgi:hypothetical protein
MIDGVLDDIASDEEKANYDQSEKKRDKRDEPDARVFSKPRCFLWHALHNSNLSNTADRFYPRFSVSRDHIRSGRRKRLRNVRYAGVLGDFEFRFCGRNRAL